MAYPNDCIPSQAVSDLANEDVSRLVGEIGKFNLQSEPYTAVVPQGNLPNVSREVRFVVAERALPGSSLTIPVFVNSENACALPGTVTQVGSTEFTAHLGTLRDRGPKVCVKTTRTAWPGTYEMLANSLKMSIREVVAADIRATLLVNGGLKLIAKSGTAIDSLMTGDYNTVGANFLNATLPTGPISFRGLEQLGTIMREDLLVDPYEGDGDEGALMAIFGMDSIQRFRDELDIREDTRALTTGRYAMGEETISGYRFKGPYHGIAFGIDRRPLRFTTFSTVANGGTDPRTGVVNAGSAYAIPNLIEPYIGTAVTKGVGARTRSTWRSATYEIGFLVGYRPFKRLTPEYNRVPGWDFNLPIANDGLKFKVLDDADCNFWEDYGQHRYEIERAYQPVTPHAVAAIAFKRCPADTGIVDC